MRKPSRSSSRRWRLSPTTPRFCSRWAIPPRQLGLAGAGRTILPPGAGARPRPHRGDRQSGQPAARQWPVRRRHRAADAGAGPQPRKRRNCSSPWGPPGGRRATWTAAKLHYRAALVARPDYAPALANLADLLCDEGQRDVARTLYDKAIKAEPGNAQARLNRAILHFLNGDLKQGWRDYAARLEVPGKVPASAS